MAVVLPVVVPVVVPDVVLVVVIVVVVFESTLWSGWLEMGPLTDIDGLSNSTDQVEFNDLRHGNF